MVNKKGWMRIIEASIAALLIISVVLIYSQGNRSSESSQIYPQMESILDDLTKNDQFREKIFSDNSVDAFIDIEGKVNALNVKVELRICDMIEFRSDGCRINKPLDARNIDSYKRVISTSPQKTFSAKDESKIISVIVYEI